MNIIIDRNSKKEEFKNSKMLIFLYNTIFGRMILKLLTTKSFSNLGRMYMNSKLSIPLIKKHIKKYDVDMTKYTNIKYKSYNEYFTRKLSIENTNFNKNDFISPCESNLLVIKIENNTKVKIKNSYYSINEIMKDEIGNEYIDGYMLIFRLAVNNYHHYCYIDNCRLTRVKHIDGILHTVQPISYDKTKVFHQNTREWQLMHTENFGNIIEVEVGALLVGKINNNENITGIKGQEKGYFEFGGSTIILLIKKDQVILDQDIIKNSLNGYETKVKYQEKIGIKKIVS